MQTKTLCFLLRDNEICLGMKKRGFGSRKWNGFGGEREGEESLEEAASRELQEEAQVTARKLEKVAEITYHFPDKSAWDQVVHIYLVTEWEGEPAETDEMRPEWFAYDQIPYGKM